jgi:hypothetical protein
LRGRGTRRRGGWCARRCVGWCASNRGGARCVGCWRVTWCASSVGTAISAKVYISPIVIVGLAVTIALTQVEASLTGLRGCAIGTIKFGAATILEDTPRAVCTRRQTRCRTTRRRTRSRPNRRLCWATARRGGWPTARRVGWGARSRSGGWGVGNRSGAGRVGRC